MIEAEETYKLALLMKTEFAKYGLKTVISRNNESEVVSSFGTDGRLHRAYKSKAKYYIELQMNGSTNTSLRGTQVVYSSFASNRVATIVFKSLMETGDLVSTGNYSKGNISGVCCQF